MTRQHRRTSPNENNKAPRITTQMMTLGMSDRDSTDTGMISPAVRAPNNNPRQRPWWKTVQSRLEGYTAPSPQEAAENDTNTQQIYASLEEPASSLDGAKQPSRTTPDNPNNMNYAVMPSSPLTAAATVATPKSNGSSARDSLLEEHNSPHHHLDVSTRPPSRDDTKDNNNTLDDHDNFFFRRGQRKRVRRTSTWMVRAATTDTTGLPSFAYSQAVDVIAPPVLQRYRAKFAQLNQKVSTEQTIHLHHDLELSLEDDFIIENHRILRSDTVETSSLFFQLADKTVMRLPRDQVRLLMDPDLEAGLLSVEQWRQDDDKPWTAREASQQPPSLRYVLTVDDDLYRKVVADMSVRLTEPYLSTERCCLEDEKVDIRVAIILLVFVLTVVFLTTIEWPTE